MPDPVTFTIESGKMVVSDPGYENFSENFKINTVLDVLNGNWLVSLVYDEVYPKRVQRIAVVNDKYVEDISEDAEVDIFKKLEKEDYALGVDTGLLCFYDKKYYYKSKNFLDQIIKKMDNYVASFLEDIPKKGKNYGFISTTGFGDGMYDIFVAKDKGKVVAIEVVFITQKERDMWKELTKKSIHKKKN